MARNYDWEELDRLFFMEGSNVDLFCAKHHIPKTTLRGHLRRNKEKQELESSAAAEETQIIPVTLLAQNGQESGSDQPGSSSIKIHIRDICIELQEGFSKEMLKEVLEVTRSLC